MAVRRRPHRQHRGLSPLGPGGPPSHRGVQLLAHPPQGLLCGRALLGRLGPGAQHRRGGVRRLRPGGHRPHQNDQHPLSRPGAGPLHRSAPHVRDGLPLYPPQPGPQEKGRGESAGEEELSQDRGGQNCLRKNRSPQIEGRGAARAQTQDRSGVNLSPVVFTAIQRSTIHQR